MKNKAACMDVWLAFCDNGFYILYEFFRGRTRKPS